MEISLSEFTHYCESAFKPRFDRKTTSAVHQVLREVLGHRMQAIGFPGAFASAAKIASRCRFEDADDPVVVDRMDKMDRWQAARRRDLNAEVAARVFVDLLHLSARDRIEDREQRWQTVCQIDGLAVVLAAHTHTDEGQRMSLLN